jgi:hypothetical protein
MKTRCGHCGRTLPRVGKELDKRCGYSQTTGNHYCPPARWVECDRIHRRLLRQAAERTSS